MRRALYRQKFRQNTNAMRFSTESQITQNTASKEINAAKNTSEIIFSQRALVAGTLGGIGSGLALAFNPVDIEKRKNAKNPNQYCGRPGRFIGGFIGGATFFGTLAEFPQLIPFVGLLAGLHYLDKKDLEKAKVKPK